MSTGVIELLGGSWGHLGLYVPGGGVVARMCDVFQAQGTVGHNPP